MKTGISKVLWGEIKYKTRNSTPKYK